MPSNVKPTPGQLDVEHANMAHDLRYLAARNGFTEDGKCKLCGKAVKLSGYPKNRRMYREQHMYRHIDSGEITHANKEMLKTM